MKAIRDLLSISRLRLMGGFIILLFLALALFAPLIAPHDPWETKMPYLPHVKSTHWAPTISARIFSPS